MILEELIAEQILARGLVSPAQLEAMRRRGAGGDSRPLEVLLLEEGLVDHATLQEVMTKVWGESAGRSSTTGSAARKRTRASADSWDVSAVSDAPAAPVGGLREGQEFTLRPGLKLFVRGVLGRGGMGVVYLVMDPGLRRLAALKVVLPGDAKRVARFKREAVITARLDHPGVPPVFEAGRTADGLDYLLMQYLPGKSLDDKLKTLREQYDQPPITELRTFLQDLVRVCEAAAYAHSRGVVHRDLKPSNIMLGSFGEVCVVDWGLARDMAQTVEQDALDRSRLVPTADSVGLTQDGALLGTVGYLPPEQARGHDVDQRADVFALGAILSVVLTGRPPIASESALHALAQIRGGYIVYPCQRRKDLPPELAAIARKALAPVVDDRYASAEALARDLAAFLEGRSVSVHAYGRTEQTRRLIRENPAPFAGLAAAFAVALVGVALLFEVRARAAEGARAVAVARARRAGEEAQARLKESEQLSAGERIARALSALGAAERWHALAPADADAARLHFEAALGLGEVARSVEQWALAEEAYTMAAKLDVNASLADRLKAEARQAANSVSRRRQEQVAELLEAAVAGDLRRASEGLTEAAFTVARYPEPETVALLCERLSKTTGALRAVVAAAPGELELRMVAVRQREVVGQGELDAVRVCCEALGWIGGQGEAVKALGAYLHAEADEQRALFAARALCRIGGEQAVGYVRDKLYVFGSQDTSLFTNQIGRVLRAHDLEIPLESDDAKGHFRRGMARLVAGRGRGAAADFREVLESVPNDAQAWCNLADAVSLQGDETAAVAAYDRAIEFGGGRATTYVNRAGSHYNLGNFDAALSDCERAIALDPTLSGAYDTRGLVKGKLGDWSGALLDHERAVKLAPLEAMHWVNLASARHGTRDWDGAIAACDRALALDGKLPWAFSNRGIAYMRKGDLARSAADFERVIELAPEHPVGWMNRGSVRRKLHDFEGARADLRRALDLDPTSAKAWFCMASLRSDEGDRAGALSDLSRAIDLDPSDAGSWLERGRILKDAGRLQAALSDHTKVVELAPDAPSSWTARSHVYLLMGDPVRALADLARALELTPDAPGLWLNKGMCLQRMGRWPDALSAYENALRLDPDSVVARKGRGYSRRMLKDYQGALEDYAWVLRHSPGNAIALWERACLYNEIGDHEAALRDMDAAIAIEPQRGGFLGLRGNIRRQSGDLQGAIEDLRRALKMRLPDAVRRACESDLRDIEAAGG